MALRIHVRLVCRQSGGGKEAAPVDERRVVSLLLEGRRIHERRDALWGGYRKNPHLPGSRQPYGLGETGGTGGNLAGQDRCIQLAAGIIGNVLDLGRIGSGRLECHGGNQMVQSAGYRTAAHRHLARVLLVGRHHVGEILVGAVLARDDGRVVADGSGDHRQIAEILGEAPDQRANDDGRGVDHQRAVVGGGVLDEETDGLAAAAAGHVLVRGRADDAGFGQRLSGAAGGTVPAAAGAAGNEEMDLVDDLVRCIDGAHCAKHQCHRNDGGQSQASYPIGSFHFVCPSWFKDVMLSSVPV